MKPEVRKNLSLYDVLWSPKSNKVFLTLSKPWISEDSPVVYNSSFEKDSPSYNMLYLIAHHPDADNNEVRGLLSPGTGWLNKKNLEMYTVTGIVMDATNKCEGELKVLYTKGPESYVRTLDEFLNKFLPSMDNILTIECSEINYVYTVRNEGDKNA